MPDGEFFPPEQYSALWPILGVVIVAVLVTFYILLFRLTRPPRRPHPPAHGAFDVPPTSTELRRQYLDLIAYVEDQHRRGALPTREAHQRLGVLVREFTFTTKGERVLQMTLEDLHRADQRELARVVERLYPGSFAPDPSDTVQSAAGRARELVQRWS